MPSVALPSDSEDFWQRVRARFVGEFPGFHEEPWTPVPGTRDHPAPPSLVGEWSGRLWQIAFEPPHRFAPGVQVGFATGAWLSHADRTTEEPMPWLFVGLRPGVMTPGTFDHDRITMRYRRREGNFKGTLTGDPTLDRRWAVYPFDDRLAPIFHDASVVAMLHRMVSFSPNPRSTIPTIAVMGTEATLTIKTAERPELADKLPGTLREFASILDRMEEAMGNPSASRRVLPMDLVRDDQGSPFPVVRFQCPTCQQSAHPRYLPNLDSQVCDKCGKLLYRFR